MELPSVTCEVGNVHLQLSHHSPFSLLAWVEGESQYRAEINQFIEVLSVSSRGATAPADLFIKHDLCYLRVKKKSSGVPSEDLSVLSK